MSPTDVPKSSGFSSNPLFWLSVIFAAGILAGRFYQTPWPFALGVCLAAGAFAAIWAREVFSVVLLSASFLFAGVFSYQLGTQSPSISRVKTMIDDGRILSDDVAEIEGLIDGRPERASGGAFFKVRVENVSVRDSVASAKGKVRVFVPLPEYDTIGSALRVRFACRLTRANNFNNPGGVPRAEILDAQGIDATCTLKSRYLLEELGPLETDFIMDFVFGLREKMIAEFRSRFSVSTAGVMIASLLGSKNFLDRPTAELFRDGGTFHVLVISGLHITFIGGLSLLIVRLITRRRLWHFLLATSFLWAFSIAVGAEVPVIRAAIMFTILLFSQVVNRRGKMLNSLGFCAITMLAWRPEDLFTQSFQLTFLSVTSLVAGAFPLIEKLRSVGEWQPSAATPFPPDVPQFLKSICETLYWNAEKWRIEKARNIWSGGITKAPFWNLPENRAVQTAIRFIFEGIVVSLIVQIWLLPLSALYFNRISFSSVLLNLWVGAFIALESFAAVLAIVIAQFNETVAVPVIVLTEVFNALLLWLPAMLVKMDFAGIRVPAYGGPRSAVYLAFYLPIVIITIATARWLPLRPGTILSAPARQSQKRGAKVAVSALLMIAVLTCIIVFHPNSAPEANGRLRVDFLDVGQGDAILVTFPNGETMLIDGGGRPKYGKQFGQRAGAKPELFEPDAPTIGETVVSRFLWSRGYSSVDYVVATHADADHIQGLSAVLKNFRVRTVFIGRSPSNDDDFAEFSAESQRKRVPVVVVKRGDALNIGGADVEFLFPESDNSSGATSDNDHSVVIRIGFGARRFLLTGDIERATENFLVANTALRADVVKVAHHGSRTSSTQNFVDATRAEFAIFSVGQTSPFGHPHPEIVDRWVKSGARIFTTGESGTVTVSTDGREILVEKCLK